MSAVHDLVGRERHSRASGSSGAMLERRRCHAEESQAGTGGAAGNALESRSRSSRQSLPSGPVPAGTRGAVGLVPSWNRPRRSKRAKQESSLMVQSRCENQRRHRPGASSAPARSGWFQRRVIRSADGLAGALALSASSRSSGGDRSTCHTVSRKARISGRRSRVSGDPIRNSNPCRAPGTRIRRLLTPAWDSRVSHVLGLPGRNPGVVQPVNQQHGRSRRW